MLMCVILTTVVELATDTFLMQQETAFRGDPSISDIWDPPFSDSIRITLSVGPSTRSEEPVTQAVLYYSYSGYIVNKMLSVAQ